MRKGSVRIKAKFVQLSQNKQKIIGKQESKVNVSVGELGNAKGGEASV